MAIPEGYRLLTQEDVGKRFGLELDPYIWLDPDYKYPSDWMEETDEVTFLETPRITRTIQTYNSSDAISHYIRWGGYELYHRQYNPSTGLHVVGTHSDIDEYNSTPLSCTVSGWSADRPDWNGFLYVKDAPTHRYTRLLRESELLTYGMGQRTVYGQVKARIEKPTQAQKDCFVDSEIALVADDVEPVEGIHGTSYINMDLGAMDSSLAGVILEFLQLRWETDKSFYYLWEDGLPAMRIFAEANGLDASVIVSEGWYLLYDSIYYVGEQITQYDFPYWRFHPLGDYLESLFDYKTRSGQPAGIFNADVLLPTANKMCPKDIIVLGDRKFQLVHCNTEGLWDHVQYEGSRYIYLEVKVVSSVQQLQNALILNLYDTSEWSGTTSIHVSGDGFDAVYTNGRTFGARLMPYSSDLKITGFYTNATILSQSETEVMITGLRHNTHVVVMVEPA